MTWEMNDLCIRRWVLPGDEDYSEYQIPDAGSQIVTDLRHKPVDKKGVTNWSNVNMKKLKKALLKNFPMGKDIAPRKLKEIHSLENYKKKLPDIFRAIDAIEE